MLFLPRVQFTLSGRPLGILPLGLPDVISVLSHAGQPHIPVRSKDFPFLLQVLSEAPLLHVHVTYWPFLSIKVLNLHKGDLA